MKPLFFLSITACFILFSCKQPGEQTEGRRGGRIEVDTIARGKYLVETMDCGNCHSPKKMTDQGPIPDETRLLSGHPSSEKLPEFDKRIFKKGLVVMNGTLTAFSGAFGTSYSANLTPDETGIGSWSFDQFKKAMKEGKYKGMDNTRMLLPPMPWQAFRNLTNEDLKAIFIYLKSIKPISNVVPEVELPGAG